MRIGFFSIITLEMPKMFPEVQFALRTFISNNCYITLENFYQEERTFIIQMYLVRKAEARADVKDFIGRLHNIQTVF